METNIPAWKVEIFILRQMLPWHNQLTKPKLPQSEARCVVLPQCTWSFLTEERGTYKAKENTFLIAVANSDENKPAHFENKAAHFYT